MNSRFKKSVSKHIETVEKYDSDPNLSTLCVQHSDASTLSKNHIHLLSLKS